MIAWYRFAMADQTGLSGIVIVEAAPLPSPLTTPIFPAGGKGVKVIAILVSARS